ncbi:GNAT family N-acetyltransferase [Acidaminobacter sp. JC074]|uniref:GNAT family N-acetyltransferase n=1 Tax=Acidaminobacter sp. JC074 TaxID=2530199 RepID=UPI001F10FEC1|nr:GNAT family protein [Acidaminobacter sp. JC074]MCH4886205.1 GNAT family N-acetyltransferase [Acidaminobacter sp. JC074]
MIKGSLVTLRMYRSFDEVVEVFDAFNTMEIRAITDHTELYHPNNLRGDFEKNGLWSKDKGTLLIVNHQDEKLGTISFSRSTEQEVQIGYRIYAGKDRNKGYMTQALRLFSSYLFETIPFITRLSLLTAEDNVPSRKLAEKCGYRQEGMLRNAYFYRGKICNWVIYGLLREEVE